MVMKGVLMKVEGVGGTWSEESLAMISAVGWRLFAGMPILGSMGSCWTWT
jgi:hypothetical protein